MTQRERVDEWRIMYNLYWKRPMNLNSSRIQSSKFAQKFYLIIYFVYSCLEKKLLKHRLVILEEILESDGKAAH